MNIIIRDILLLTSEDFSYHTSHKHIVCDEYRAHQQHSLPSDKARSLSITRLHALTDDQAFDLFLELRWGKGEEVTCPCCGSVAKHYFLKTRSQWRCRDCKHTSVTSGTIFAFHKLPLKDQQHRSVQVLAICNRDDAQASTGTECLLLWNTPLFQ